MTHRALPYEQVRTLAAQLGGQSLQIVTKPGFPGWDTIGPAEQLLYGAVQPGAAGCILALGCGHGALAAALARQSPAAQVLLADTSCIALAMARRTLAANAIANARVLPGISALPEYAGACGDVLMLTPPDRKLARRWLLEAWHALADDGRLWLAGANDHGIRSIIADAAELFGAAPVLAYRHGHRVARAQRGAGAHALPEWAGAPGIAPGTWREFSAELRGYRLKIRSLPGVFAHDRVDDGTRLLLETIDAPAGARVLDLGCGSGVIGALAARMGAAEAELADSNLLAVASAGATLAANALGNARACAADGVPPGRQGYYDLVLSNPPFHVGKAVDYDVARAFIAQTRQALRPGGQFILVANQFLRYDQILSATFDHVASPARTGSFRIWQAA